MAEPAAGWGLFKEHPWWLYFLCIYEPNEIQIC